MRFALLLSIALLIISCGKRVVTAGRDPGAFFGELVAGKVLGIAWGSAPTDEMLYKEGNPETYTFFDWPQANEKTGGRLQMTFLKDRFISADIQGLSRDDYEVLRDWYFDNQNAGNKPSSECPAPAECWSFNMPDCYVDIGWNGKSLFGTIAVGNEKLENQLRNSVGK